MEGTLLNERIYLIEHIIVEMRRIIKLEAQIPHFESGKFTVIWNVIDNRIDDEAHFIELQELKVLK